MARSPTHKFGQIIGDILEALLHAPLKSIADGQGLYLDFKHRRRVRGAKSKVSWDDGKGNSHDLDYVLEQGGSEEVRGNPKAFIETAWRRYTKHSRNKVQEILCAVGNVADAYKRFRPFLGVVFAGEFTGASITHISSHKFVVLHIPYSTIVAAFAEVGINASFDEKTPDATVQKKVDAYGKLSAPDKSKIPHAILNAHGNEFAAFFKSLESSLTRTLTRIFIVPLHGSSCDVATVAEAIRFIEGYDESQNVAGFVGYEVNVRYSNADNIVAQFVEKERAIAFLQGID